MQDTADYERIVSDVIAVFRACYGDIPHQVILVEEVEPGSGDALDGACSFNSSPPNITVRRGLSEVALTEALVHEFAHLACGYAAGHNERWTQCRDDLSVRVAAFALTRWTKGL